MFKVKIKNKTYLAEENELLSDILVRNGLKLPHICGGRGVCGKCKVNVNGKEELSCKYKIKSDIEVSLPLHKEILSPTGSEDTGFLTENMCFALDIGTTTLAMALVSLDNGDIVKTITRSNPQSVFGADVITRIDYCTKNGVDVLQKLLVDEINVMTKALYEKALTLMYVAGNTTMLHILFGENPSSMGVAPYTPVFTEGKTVSAESIGIKNAQKIISADCVSAFVGADLVAGLNYVGLPDNGKYNLLVDLGTNAEILLFSDKKLVCTSAAAGPCFEGANISCGMSATEGAISEFCIENGNARYQTIGGAEPSGICGTGLIDIISVLLKNNIIDETGYMECELYRITEKVYISQKDIRQYQLAKSAVRSAIETLINGCGIDYSRIDKLYVSGGFSAKINMDNAVYTGLFPKELKYKALPINNSSLLGTVKFAIEGDKLNKYIEKAEYLDLALNSEFNDLFVENIDF